MVNDSVGYGEAVAAQSIPTIQYPPSVQRHARLNSEAFVSRDCLSVYAVVKQKLSNVSRPFVSEILDLFSTPCDCSFRISSNVSAWGQL